MMVPTVLFCSLHLKGVKERQRGRMGRRRSRKKTIKITILQDSVMGKVMERYVDIKTLNVSQFLT